MGDAEFLQQPIQHDLLALGIGLADFDDRLDVLLDVEAAEHARFLGQVAYAETRPAIHGQRGDRVAVQRDLSAIGADEAHDHVEGGGFSGAVGAKQTDRLAALHGDRHPAHHGALLEALPEASGDETRPRPCEGTRRFSHCQRLLDLG
jgi:hypothetical protein